MYRIEGSKGNGRANNQNYGARKLHVERMRGYEDAGMQKCEDEESMATSKMFLNRLINHFCGRGGGWTFIEEPIF